MATFTKQNYEAVARVLKGARPSLVADVERQEAQMAQWENTVLAFLNMFQQDNPAFDRGRFMKACK